METLTIDLKKKKSFEIGQQGDHNALCIHFINMKNVGTNKKYIYYTIDGIENCVPLTNDRFIVGYPLTAHSGIAFAQLISKLNDNSIIKLSNVFAMNIKESKGYKDSGKYPVDPNIQSSYDLLDDLINETKDLINNYNYATLMEKLTQASSEATTSATTAKKCADELKNSTDFINTLDDKVAAQDSKIENIEASTRHITTKQNTKIAALQTRMSEFTSLKDGSTTGDAELIDARIGADGTKYPSAGDAVREQVDKLNKVLGDYSNISIDESGYVSTLGSVLLLDVVENSSYRHKILECNEGDLFTVTSDSGLSALPYTFIDENNIVLDQPKVASVKNAFIIAPKNTKKVIFNTGNIPDVVVNHGWTSVQKALSHAYDFFKTNDEKINILNKLTYSFKNNLKNEFNKITYPFDVIKDGIADLNSYGDDNVIYKINVGDCDKLHGYFEFKFTEKIPYTEMNNPFSLFTYGASSFEGDLYLNDFSIQDGKIYRASNVVLNNSYIGGESKQYSLFTTKSLIGKDSFYVQYNGSLEDVTMELSETAVTFKNGESVLNTITFNPDDSVDSLIEKIKALSYIDVSFVNTLGMKCSDLVRKENLLIPLVYTFDSQIDKPRIYIPYDLDEEWHTVEFMYDKDKLISYFAFDGLTVENKVSVKSFGTSVDGILQIGGKFNGHESPIRIRNLELDVNSYGDCEIVDSIAYPYKAQKQLISKHNPRLLIYEGHGIDNINDSNAPISDDMACSTDRLLTVFKTLTNKGYVPVTYQQIKDWKINNCELPKRCFNLMFDDYRIENYMDIANRYPFMKYNVKAGLAIISDSKELTDTVEIDGTSYTIDEVFKAIKNGCWHTCSHTNSHTPVDDILPSQLPQKLKECVISCDKHNINSDIIVYPLGKISNRSLSALEHSDFALGINIVTDRYNCRALPDMNLTRVEIGSRTSIENVLSTIV